MDLLNNILGGGKEKEYQDFNQRYQQGKPWEGYTGEEVSDRYRQVAGKLPPDVYEESAEESFRRLDPDQRRQFHEWMRSQAREQGVQSADLDRDDLNYDDPRELARVTSGVQRRQPGLMDQLLGKGGTGGPLDNPIAKAAFAGVVAIAAGKLMGGRR